MSYPNFRAIFLIACLSIMMPPSLHLFQLSNALHLGQDRCDRIFCTSMLQDREREVFVRHSCEKQACEEHTSEDSDIFKEVAFGRAKQCATPNDGRLMEEVPFVADKSAPAQPGI